MTGGSLRPSVEADQLLGAPLEGQPFVLAPAIGSPTPFLESQTLTCRSPDRRSCECHRHKRSRWRERAGCRECCPSLNRSISKSSFVSNCLCCGSRRRFPSIRASEVLSGFRLGLNR